MARIVEEDIDRLRDSADIVEIVSAYTNLKKSGGHRFVGLCPFHSEKTPSFQVDTAKGLTYCFGCGEGGNVYQFVQKIENLPFPEAVEWLARKLNFPLRYEEQRPGEQQRAGLKARLIAANAAAAGFFHETLFTAPDADPARKYLESRGFGKDVAKRWLLGYAPGRDALCKYLQKKGFTEGEIVTAELGRRGERDNALYDFFRQRITFPTWNLQGDVVAFGARALGDQQPKYLNSPDTPVFSKSRLMYGLDRAKSAIARSSAVIVEGYTDVIALHEAGVTQAVATNGTALGETHLELLKKFTNRAVLMFDSDQAGRGAAEKGWGDSLNQAPLASRVGIELLVAPLPAGHDPADLVRQNGPDAITTAMEEAHPLLEFKLEQTIAKLPLDTPEARSAAVREAARVLGWHTDPIARHEYAFKTASRIGVDVEVVHQALNEIGSSGRVGGAELIDRDRRLPGHVKVEREALTLLLTRADDAAPRLGDVTEEEFTSPVRREVFRRAVELLRTSRLADAAGARDLSPDAQALFTELTMMDIPATDLDARVREVFTRVKLFALEREIKARRNTLQDVNPLDDPAAHDALFTELVGLEARRRDLLRLLQSEPEEVEA